MNSDAVLRELNKLTNDQRLNSNQRKIIFLAMRHITDQDKEIDKIREDVSQWRDPDEDTPGDP